MTERYAVIGNPIGHTKSPLIHGLFAQATRQDMTYTAIEGPTAPEDGFARAVRAFAEEGGKGLNVTAPFKLQAFDLADDASERARLAGAANALKFEAGRVRAENFDGIGLMHDIESNLGLPLAGRRVLLLGAGGAARGAILPFLAAAPRELVIVNRDMRKARELMAQVASYIGGNCSASARSYSELGGAGAFDLVVNATSASLTGGLPPVPATVFSRAGMAYELAYGKGLTPFLRLARNAGVERLADGVGMLVEQAAEAFAWWRGVRPQTRAVIQQLTVPLE